jgi:ribosomal protein S6
LKKSPKNLAEIMQKCTLSREILRATITETEKLKTVSKFPKQVEAEKYNGFYNYSELGKFS